MRVIREGPVYQITIFKGESLSVNCYIVEEKSNLILIDTAIPGSSEEIIQVSKNINKPITKILLTHAHHDHIGGLDSIKQMLPNAQIYISRREARLLTGDRSLDPEEPNTPIAGVIPKNVKTQADFFLHEGNRIGSLLVLATPGHTPGSMSFLETYSNALIVGDSFQTEGGIAVAGQLRPSFPFPALGTWNKLVALVSAHKLLQYSPSLLATGHGPMIKKPYQDMQLAINQAEQNEFKRR